MAYSEWWTFCPAMVESDRDDPGIYQLCNADGAIICVGISNRVRRRLLELLTEEAWAGMREKPAKYRVEYTGNYLRREQDPPQRAAARRDELQ